MGFWEKFKSLLSGKGNPSAKQDNLYKVFSYSPFSLNPSAEDDVNAIYQSCIDQYSTTISKIKPIIAENHSKTDRFPNIDYHLRYQPNPMQTANDFFSQIADDYFHRTCAVIWVDRDYSESNHDRQVKNLWVIDTGVDNFKFSVTKSENGNTPPRTIFSFTINGKQIVTYDDDIVILPWHPTHENPYIRSNKALQNILKISNRNFTGLEETLNNANIIRFIAQSPRVMSDADLRLRQELLNNTIKAVDSNGALYIDSVQQITQLSTGPGWNHSSEVKAFEGEIYDYFGLCEDIVNNKCSDDMYNQWIEGPVSAFIDKLETALTLKLFSREQIDCGLAVSIGTSPLYRRSRSHQIQLANVIVSSGVYYPNEIREIVGVPKLNDEDNIKVCRIDRVDAEEEQKGEENGKTGETEGSPAEEQSEQE